MIQWKRSTTAGNIPNLVPGQIGINAADEILWVRANGVKVPVDINKLRYYAAPLTKGQDGAPLIKIEGGSEWCPSLAPSSVVAGAITVDQPMPNNIYGIPGIFLTGLGDPVTIPANRTIAEEFYVASDWITIDRIAFKIVSQTQSLVRFAIANFDDDTIIYTANLSSPSDASVNTVNLNLNLPRGRYRVIFWSGQTKELQEVLGFSYDQGFNTDGSDNLVFLNHKYTTADFSSGIDISNVSWTDLTALTPGTRRFFAFHWTIPVNP